MKNICITIFCLLLFSCEKENNTNPVIIIVTPADKQVFSAPQLVQIKINVTAEKGLDIVHLKVVNMNNSIAIIDLERFFLNTTLVIDTSCTVQPNTTYKLSIEALDNEAGRSYEEISFSAN